MKEVKVRYLRFSQIDQITDLPYETRRELARRASNKKRGEDPISLKKIVQGDNREWEVLYESLFGRLKSFVLMLVKSESGVEDIVSNSIADIYVSRHTFESIDHMIGYAFNYARIESFNWIFKGPGRFIMDDDIIVKMDWYVNLSPEEELSPMERAMKDKWKDDMLNLVNDVSRRLPNRWRRLVRAYLKCHSSADVRRIMGTQSTAESGYARKSCFGLLKKLISHKLTLEESITEEETNSLREVIIDLTPRQKKIVKLALQGKKRRDIADIMKLTRGGLRSSLESIVHKIADVWNDPLLEDDHHFYFEFLSNPKGEVIDKIFREVILDTDETSWKHALRRIMTKDELREVHLLRLQKKMSWENLSIHFKIGYDSLKTQYAERYQENEEEIKIALRPMVGEDNTSSKLTIIKVREIRDLYAEGNVSQHELGLMFGVARGTIQSIVNGTNWKYVEGGSIAIRRARALCKMQNESDDVKEEDIEEVIRLRDSGMALRNIASKYNVSVHKLKKVLPRKGSLGKGNFKIPTCDYEKIEKLIKNKIKDIKEVASEYRVHRSTILWILKKLSA